MGSLFREAEHEHEGHGEAEFEQEAESPLSEAQEMELTSELLEVSSEAELDHFFGKLARAAVRGAKGFARSAGGRMLGGMLKSFVKKALPIAGTAVGVFFGGPLGAKLGGSLGNVATNLFEMELEGLSHEDREFEMARQVVRLGAAAMNRAARLPRLQPQLAARRAFTAAARLYAPGLFRGRHHCRACAARGRRHVQPGPRRYTTGPGYGVSRGVGPRSVSAGSYGAPGYTKDVRR